MALLVVELNIFLPGNPKPSSPPLALLASLGSDERGVGLASGEAGDGCSVMAAGAFGSVFDVLAVSLELSRTAFWVASEVDVLCT